MQDTNTDPNQILNLRVRNLSSQENLMNEYIKKHEFDVSFLDAQINSELNRLKDLLLEVQKLHKKVTLKNQDMKKLFKNILKKDKLNHFENKIDKYTFEQYISVNEFERLLERKLEE